MLVTPSDTDLNSVKNAPRSAIRAYLGGSFDPVHNGHMQMAMHVYQCLLPIAEQQQRALYVSLLPNARSPFKQQSIDPAHRLAMLELATQDTPLQINELELWQKPPVYTIDSVHTLRQRYPNDCLIFIMGMDSARSLEKWKDGLQLTDYVHLWLFDRDENLANDHINKPDISPQALSIDQNDNKQNLSTQNLANLYVELPPQLQAQITKNPIDLTQLLSDCLERSKFLKNSPRLKDSALGRIYIDSRSVMAISSTDIRQQLREPLFEQLPTNDFIASNKPNNLAHLLNPTVYQYIIAHQLYSAAQFR
ncbi:nicotinate-nucleotide adenylyltransferase [Psychrobacter sp. PL15]|uniref:nicotinate-nicotinamide nucleotide adenylyltransferase n=1 Tax=Psychrobacter sp. PL15 TaxID=3071719 RepID=UPI002DF7AA38|nr:nicotinate-nucleotide adenylyltransferase [Psychrobacter sp. PL15]